MLKRLSIGCPWHRLAPARSVALQKRSRLACSSSTRRAGGRASRLRRLWPTTRPQSSSRTQGNSSQRSRHTQ
eukprot:4793038-Pleurochrysis_carterae.AAC.1